MTEQNKYSTTPRDYNHVGPVPKTIATGKQLGKVDPTSQSLARDIRNFAWAEDTQESIARFIEWCSISYNFTNDNIDFLVNRMNTQFSDALRELSEDIRIGYDGTVYDSPGEAVRQQIVASMGVIIDNRLHRTNAVAVNINYDINQLDLSGAQIQVKFDSKIVGGVGSKFIIRHSNSSYGRIGEPESPVMESSSEGTSHVYIVDITDNIIESSKFLTVTSNGASGTDKVDLEITNIEIRTVGLRINAGLKALGDVVVISSEQTKPIVEKGEVLLEYDTGNVFFYDGTEWIDNIFFYDGTEWRELL